MAAKRVTKSALNWVGYAERIKPSAREGLRLFRAKHDSFVKDVSSRPASLPKIDFKFYRSQLANKALVDELEKEYQKVDVTYPKATQALFDELKDIKEKRAVSQADFKKYLELQIKKAKEYSQIIDRVPPADELTVDMTGYYFPDMVMTIQDVKENPKFWPFTPEDQVDEVFPPGMKAHLD